MEDDWSEIEAMVDGKDVKAAAADEVEVKTEVQTEVPETAEVKTEVETKTEPEAKTETTETETKAEPPRDEKGRFIPLDRHEDILDRQRERAEKLQRENEELRAKLEAVPKPPDETDKAFEDRIANFPEEMQAILREQRDQIKTLTRSREEERRQQQQDEAAKKEATEHDTALAATETLTQAWKDKGLRAMLVTISNEMVDDPKYQAADRAAHYKDVERVFYERYPQLKPATAGKTTTSTPTEPRLPAAPSSISALRGAVPHAKNNAEAFESADPLMLAATTSTMSEAELDRYFASLN